jgi:thiosulfate dehydrogenase [quinone] large subunit
MTLLRNWTNEAWAFLLLRLFLGLRLLLAGLDKYERDGAYSFAAYYTNARRIAAGIADHSFLPGWLTYPYAYTLGHLMLALGGLLLLGVCTRVLLVVAGLVFLSLAAGLMAVGEDGGVAWLGIHLLATAAALVLARHERLALGPGPRP